MSFWSRRDGVCFLLCFAVAFGVYVFSLPPSVTLEDAGELAVAADWLGVPHPPGYPIWTFLAWFFQWIFHFVEFRGYPNPAWPIALMSAFFGAAACGLVAVCIRKLLISLSAPGNNPPENLFLSFRVQIMGSLTALAVFSLLQAVPVLGKTLLLLGGISFPLLLVLQTFTSPEHRTGWQQKLPSPQTLGSGFLGFLVTGFFWMTVWYWVVIPGLTLLIPFTLIGVLLFSALSLCIRWLFGRALKSPDLPQQVQKSGMDVLLGIGGGWLLAFTPLMWSQSVIIEVYSLNAFFVASLLLLMLWYIHDPRDGILYLAAFLFALGLTNHQSLLFLVFFLVAGVAAAKKFALLKDGLFLIGTGATGFCLLKAVQYHRAEDPSAVRFFILLGIPFVLFLISLVLTRGGLFTRIRKIGSLLMLGILGLSFHLYMPVASEQNPPMNWGNARTVKGFRHALTRGQYADFSVADNVKRITQMMTTPPPEGDIRAESGPEINRYYVKRTLFLRMLGSYFYDANWKYSMANQFSWQLPLGEDDPTGTAPPPPEKHFPFALLGLLPLFCFGSFPTAARGWFVSSLLAMFFLTVVFLTIQWPELNHNDLWVKRVQYVQAHVLFSIWMALGAAILCFLFSLLLPQKSVWILGGSAAITALGFIAFPIHKEGHDPRHLEHLGSSSLRGHDFGWQYGFHQLKGANGILLDELAHHRDPDSLVNDWVLNYLSKRDLDTNVISELDGLTGKGPFPLSVFRKSVLDPLRLSEEVQRTVEQAVTLAAFRALSPEEQAARLVHLHRPLPDWDYPPEMDQNAVLFGGTDPGRFVPTYMIFSAEVRPDVFIITQTALADDTYQITTRDLYGDRMYIPDLVAGNQAFLDYGNELRLFRPEAFYQLMGRGQTLSISGVDQVNEINSRLSRVMFERNAPLHSFYLEEALRMEWMTFHKRPHGLIFKLENEPVELTAEDRKQDMDFWNWYEEHLLRTEDGKRNRYQRDLPVRKSFSKLRMSQAWNYYERGHWAEAEQAMDQALRLYPANPEAALRAGDMYIRMLKFDRAEEILDAFAKHDPTNYQRVNFSVSLEKLRELDQLRKELEEQYRTEPTGNLALQLMQIYAQLEMREEMTAMAGVILTRPNLHVDFYIHLAAFMQREKNRTYYRKAVEKWAEKDPMDPRPFIDLACFALSDQDYQQMAVHLVRAIQLDPENSRAQLAKDPRFVDIHHWKQFKQLLRAP